MVLRRVSKTRPVVTNGCCGFGALALRCDSILILIPVGLLCEKAPCCVRIRRLVMNQWRCTFALALAVIAGTAGATGQTTTGDILGTVRDQTGAVLPAVPVTLTNMDTNVTKEAVTG